MKAVGIIAEYNPFHNGHKYQLEEAKRLAGSDAVVVAMSGNFVQRGEPAILNKWDRTKLALENGADLVLEIPTYFCLGNAKQYAHAGVKILDSLGMIDQFAFGSESADLTQLQAIADNMWIKEDEIEKGIREYAKEGLSYPVARAKVYNRLFPFTGDISILENPNDNLAINYLTCKSRMRPIAVKRTEMKSASEIRYSYFTGEDISETVPDNTLTMLSDSITTFPEKWFNTLKYAVMQTTGDEIEDCPSGGEGLGNRIKHVITQANSWDELIQETKSKRYTYTRISRLCMQIILGIKREKFPISNPGYIRLLGANDNGRELISYADKNFVNKLPIITNISKKRSSLNDEGLLLLELDAHASDVYNLVTGRDISAESDYKISPIII